MEHSERSAPCRFVHGWPHEAAQLRADPVTVGPAVGRRGRRPRIATPGRARSCSESERSGACARRALRCVRAREAHAEFDSMHARAGHAHAHASFHEAGQAPHTREPHVVSCVQKYNCEMRGLSHCARRRALELDARARDRLAQLPTTLTAARCVFHGVARWRGACSASTRTRAAGHHAGHAPLGSL